MTDALGNELKVGDSVAFPSDYICGQIVKIEEGTILKGLSISEQPTAQQQMPYILIMAQITKTFPVMGGVAPQVVKVQTPEKPSAGPAT